MRDIDLDQLFLRYRDTGDPGALGRIFDHLAPSLLVLARHVTADRDDAEDLLQATFLTAIEKAREYDGVRPISPWLTGILVHHANNRRRQTNRFIDASRVAPRPEADPSVAVERRELRDQVERALRDLPEKYRELLIRRLAHGDRGVDIAARIGRRPDVVRVQLSRALALLRRALPTGVASVATMVMGRRGLAAVRREVLTRAGGAGSFGTVTCIGGVTMSKKSALLATAVVALLASLGVWLGEHPEPSAKEAARRSPSVESSDDPDSAPVAPAAVAVEQRREPVESEGAPAGHDPSPPGSFERALAGVTGRIVEADGRPLVETSVTLLDTRMDDWTGETATAFLAEAPAPAIERDATVTDADGRFTLDGAWVSGIHALGIDLGGPRGTLRVLDRALVAGERTDLGDVRLHPVVTLRGRVVNEDGGPLVGARVRAAAVPFPVAMIGVQHYRRGRALIRVRSGESHVVFTIPDWLAAWWDRLPIPTTSTDADGRFELTGVPRDLVTLIADREGFVATVKGPLPTGHAGRDVGELVMASGRSVTGTIVDHDDRPAPGAEVLVGVRPIMGDIAVAVSARSDERGVYRVDHLPDVGSVVVAARVEPTERWTVLDPEDADEIDVDLPATVAFELEVVDESGNGVANAELRVVPNAAIEDPIAAHRALPPAVRPIGAGRFAVGPLRVGSYSVIARSPSHPVVQRVVDLSEMRGGGVETIVLPPGRSVEVRVGQGRESAPVEHAMVRATAAEYATAWGRGRTDGEGRIVLGPLPLEDGVLFVTHPGFAESRVELGADVMRVVVEMGSGHVVLGRVRIAGDPPPESVTVVLWKQLGHRMPAATPWVDTTDQRGDFGFSGLPAGEYRWQVVPRVLAGDALGAIVRLNDGTQSLAEGQVTVGADGDEPTRLDIEVMPAGGPGACTLRGRIRIDGRGVAAQVRVAEFGDGTGRRLSSRSTETDGTGGFELDGLLPGPVLISIERTTTQLDADGGRVRVFEQLFHQQLELRPAEVRELVLDLRRHPLTVDVRDAEGRPVAAATVDVRGIEAANEGLWRSGETDEGGSATLDVLSEGRVEVRAQSPSGGLGRIEVRVPLSGSAVVTLDRGVPCAGVVIVPDRVASADVPAGTLMLFARRPEGDLNVSVNVGDDLRFTAAGLTPGTVSAWYVSGPSPIGPVSFQLPPSGDGSLSLDFTE